MQRRARRVAMAAAVLGAGVFAGLAATHWGMVRDHVAAWWFVWTTETETATDAFGAHYDATKEPFSLLAAFSGRPVIFDRNAERFKFGIDWDRHVETTPLEELRRLGYRVIEQRFPRRAYVVSCRDERAPRPRVIEGGCPLPSSRSRAAAGRASTLPRNPDAATPGGPCHPTQRPHAGQRDR